MSYDHWKTTNPDDAFLGSARQGGNPHEFRVVPLSMGSFGIVNERGEEIGDPPLCYLTVASAEDAIGEMIADDDADRRLNRHRHEQRGD